MQRELSRLLPARAGLDYLMHLLQLALGLNALSIVAYFIITSVRDSSKYEPDFSSLED